MKREDPQDQSLIDSLIDLLQKHELDYSSSLRTLTKFRPTTQNLADHVAPILSSLVKSPNSNNEDDAKSDWLIWLEKFGTRIESESDTWKGDGEDWLSVREKEMKEYNPRFVLRQWVLEELIKRLREDSDYARPALLKVLEVRCNISQP